MKITVTQQFVAAHQCLMHPVEPLQSPNFLSVVRSAWPATPGPGLPRMLRMMQMALLTALMIDDNILLLVKDVFTFSAWLCPGNLVHVLTLTQQRRRRKKRKKKDESFLP